jgi:hypothetical protein
MCGSMLTEILRDGIALIVVFALIVSVALAQLPSSPPIDAQSPFSPVPSTVSDALRFSEPIPEFQAKDIGGGTWRAENLRGRFTVVYLWHTLDGGVPGYPDLPEVQRFYDHVKNDRKIQVLTFCWDYDYMHAHDYMKRMKYTFPVIADWVLVNKLFPPGQRHKPYALVDPEGRKSLPFRFWGFGRLLFEVERAAAAY